MAELTRADKYLLDAIRQGSSEGWSQLVERHQGRLLAFARSKLGQAAEAEDLVQETFISFLKALPNFRGESSIETYLFSILRHKIINWFRGRQVNVCQLQSLTKAGNDEQPRQAADQLLSPAPTASWYARRDEDHRLQHDVLTEALRELIDAYKKSLNFRNLQIIEMIFYCQLRNREIARIINVEENHVALIKHRCLKQIRSSVSEKLQIQSSRANLSQHPIDPSSDPPDALLTEIWQQQRLSCLKRNTIGAYPLGTLDEAWRDYVAFHLDRLGCEFCRANLEDLQQKSTRDDTGSLRRRIMESTVGFLNKP
ncbi:MAG: RNA polymerase sigma factor [Planctomycetota bacterium]|nr:MAG: RNA polymerase sigma factor [Planctomycetota bacterium]